MIRITDSRKHALEIMNTKKNIANCLTLSCLRVVPLTPFRNSLIFNKLRKLLFHKALCIKYLRLQTLRACSLVAVIFNNKQFNKLIN